MNGQSNSMPPAKRGANQIGVPVLRKGSKRSQAVLNRLNFDPIGQLVEKYRMLEQELVYQEKLRSQEIIELRNDGKARAYRAEIHHAIYDKLISVGEKLLRYGYGRVPETNFIEEKKTPPLIVHTTKKGETYIANEIEADYENEE
jgi:hypothetical protein